jgi:hypothetical protein
MRFEVLAAVTNVGVVLGLSAFWFCRLMSMFQRNMLSPSSGLK